MGKWFEPNVVRHSQGLEGTKRPLIKFLLLSNKHERDQFQQNGITRFVICSEAYLTWWRVVYSKASRNRNSSHENSDTDERHGKEEGDNIDGDPLYEARCSSSELLSLTQEDLNDVDPDLIVSKQQTALSGSRMKWWDILDQGTEMCFFRNCKNGLKEFFSQENDLVILMIFILLYRLMGINTIEMSSICLLTLLKSV